MRAKDRGGWRWWLRVAGAAVLMLLALPPLVTRGDATAEGYVPSLGVMARLVEATMSGYSVEELPPEPGDWGASGHYAVRGDGPEAKAIELSVAASVLPSPGRAAAQFREVVQRVEADNERLVRLQGEDAAYYAADEFRAYQLVYVDADRGERRSAYVRLVRLGRTVAAVEAAGDPAADDEGYVDSDRGLMLVRTFELVLGKLRWEPADPVGAVPGLAAHAGTWTRHGFGVSVEESGRAAGSWRVYRWCSDDPTPPCDGMVGDRIVNGGAAALVFFRAEGDVALGVVIDSADPRVLPLGPVELTRRPYGMARLSSLGRTLRGEDDLDLCGPSFGRLAPEWLRRQAPCGA